MRLTLKSGRPAPKNGREAVQEAMAEAWADAWADIDELDRWFAVEMGEDDETAPDYDDTYYPWLH